METKDTRATAVVSTGGRNARALRYVAVLPKKKTTAETQKGARAKKEWQEDNVYSEVQQRLESCLNQNKRRKAHP